MSISVSGIGLTQFGELWNKSFEDLIEEATNKALENAKCTIHEIDAVFLASMLSGETTSQSQAGAIIASLYGVHIPVFRLEAACASGGIAVYQAIQNLRAGTFNKVLVVGSEKMTDHSVEDISAMLMQAASEEERLSGATFPALYAMMAKSHMQEFGTKEEDFAKSSVISHKNGTQNPKAHFQREFSIEQVLKSAPVADPLKLLDCSPISDGAAAIILENTEKAEIEILAESSASDSLSLNNREKLTELKSTQITTEKLFSKIEISKKNIDLIEVHDCFSIAGLMALEDIGFCKKGEGGKCLEKILNNDPELPKYNLSGGLKAGGHPVGATGVKQIAEVALQFQKNPQMKYGLTHNVGGTGATCVMHLLKRNS